MMWLWFCSSHVNGFNFDGGGFGFGFWPSVCVVAKLELVVAMCWAMGCSWCGRE